MDGSQTARPRAGADLSGETLPNGRLLYRSKTWDTTASIYPLGGGGQRGSHRFRVNLAGSPGSLARLFFTLGEAAPPIILAELTLTPTPRIPNTLTATAMLDVEQQAVPAEWVAIFSNRLNGTTQLGDSEYIDRSSRGRSQTGPDRSSPGSSAFPYKSIDRRGVFQSAESGQRSRRLEAASPTIQTLTQKLIFQGVIWGDEPTAIIADQASGQVHYRTIGQFIGELEVVEITRSSATVRYKGEEGRLE